MTTLQIFTKALILVIFYTLTATHTFEGGKERNLDYNYQKYRNSQLRIEETGILGWSGTEPAMQPKSEWSRAR
jgi:hypothetical protein